MRTEVSSKTKRQHCRGQKGDQAQILERAWVREGRVRCTMLRRNRRPECRQSSSSSFWRNVPGTEKEAAIRDTMEGTFQNQKIVRFLGRAAVCCWALPA